MEMPQDNDSGPNQGRPRPNMERGSQTGRPLTEEEMETRAMSVPWHITVLASLDCALACVHPLLQPGRQNGAIFHCYRFETPQQIDFYNRTCNQSVEQFGALLRYRILQDLLYQGKILLCPNDKRYEL